jgi:hypothetical protein
VCEDYPCCGHEQGDAFQRDNAGFSRERFYIAVGLSPEGFLPASVLADYTAERKRRSA